MAAGEYEPQLIVFQHDVIGLFVTRLAIELTCELFDRRIETRAAADLSIALKRPAETSHARGLSGTPSSGHCSTAAVNASCKASSAMSKLPSRRMSVASTRRDSARYTASTDSRARAAASFTGGAVYEQGLERSMMQLFILRAELKQQQKRRCELSPI
jgi:hypothetical protein